MSLQVASLFGVIVVGLSAVVNEDTVVRLLAAAETALSAMPSAHDAAAGAGLADCLRQLVSKVQGKTAETAQALLTSLGS